MNLVPDGFAVEPNAEFVKTPCGPIGRSGMAWDSGSGFDLQQLSGARDGSARRRFGQQRQTFVRRGGGFFRLPILAPGPRE